MVRPLLPFRRAELRAHAGAVGLGAFDDPSNADLRHTRAWVRHRLLPLIAERLGHEAVRALLDVAGHAREEVLAWDRLLEVLPGLDLQVEEGRFAVARGVLSGYHNALAARVLRAAARRAGLRVGPRAATRLARFAAGAASGRRAQLGEGVAAEAAFDRLVVAVECAAAPAPVELRGESGEAEFGAYVLCWRREVMPGPPRRREWTTWIAGPDALAVRAPAAGDRLRPLGGAGHRAVRRLLMEARIPRGERARYPVVVRGTEVVWVPGVCRAEVAVPEPGTVAVRIDARTR
jgi:tRNA(Ile)-lysidine synthase